MIYPILERFFLYGILLVAMLIPVGLVEKATASPLTDEVIIIFPEVKPPTPKQVVAPPIDYSIFIPKEYRSLVVKYSNYYHIPMEYMYRWMVVESMLGKYTQSISTNTNGTTDYGIYQLNSNYIDYFGQEFYNGKHEDFDPMNAEHNIQVACAYLSHLITITGDMEMAFASYNGGVGNYYRDTLPEASVNYGKVVMGLVADERIQYKEI